MMVSYRTKQEGQALVETGLVLTLFLVLVGGIMQFGYAFLVANMITHAARDGARLAASWQDRGGCGQITDVSDIESRVKSTIATVSAATLTVTVSQDPLVSPLAPPCTAATAPTVAVNVNGCVPYVLDMLGFGTAGCPGGFEVDRTVTFDDELRGAFGPTPGPP